MVRVTILVALLSFPSLARARQAGEPTQPASTPATTKPAAKAAAAKAPRDLLARARAFYNEGRYDDAMTTAAQAHGFRQPDVTAAAWLIIGRARLERFREKSAVDDLQAAREALRQVDVAELRPRDHPELLVGLAEALFLEESFGPAAELFGTVLDRVEPREEGASRERALEWWASALDRYAQTREPHARAAVYEQIVARMERELGQNPGSATAMYWIAAGARGAGDAERAWNAAVAAWVRSPLTGRRVVDLRDDLESLVTQGIIPDRVRRMPQAQRAQAAEQLGAEWTRIKLRWGQ